ncbi:MAG: hypothetical protein PHQ81_03855 [Methanofollis sp.]|nr:hypothetical protein [Methanofollis sp.]
MAKTIKFNLILDGQPVRCIEDLQDNFCIDDIIRLYQDGLLQKWLKVRGYDDYLQQVEAIKKKDSVIVELIKIFKIEKKENVIKESLYSLEYRKKRETELQEWRETGSKEKKAIGDYHNGYETLKSKVIENKYDMAFMKATAKEISKNYSRLFQLDNTRFYYEFRQDAPLMIYAILMDTKLRDFLLQNEDVSKSLTGTFKIKSKDEAKKLIYPELNQDDDFDNKVQSIGLHIYIGDTQSYWKDLQTEDTKVLIISVPDSCRIRGAKDKLEDIPSKDANGKFLILDGLAYKSSDKYNPIVYMEI